MSKIRKELVLSTLLLFSASFALANEQEGCDGTKLKADLTAVNGSAITGDATICISDDGLRGVLEAENLKIGKPYTVWFFYIEGGQTGGPGRFDSTVAENDAALFRGHVGGLKVASGGTVKLVLFYHPDITATAPPCSPMPPTNTARADNLLNFACAGPAAVALFPIP